MKVTKIAFDRDVNANIYKDFMRDTPEGDSVRIRYNIENIKDGDRIAFGGDGSYAYHVVMDGEVYYQIDQGEIRTAKAGESFYCESQDAMDVKGNGKIVSMLMDKGIRGTIRMVSVEKETIVKVGETIGECCVAFLGLDGEFSMICGEENVRCEKDSMIVVRMAKKEFSKVRLSPDNRKVCVAVMGGVKMFDADFGRQVGLYTIEQGYGHCKVRLDVQKEHMNPIGSVHGGCLFTMADEASGIAASTTGGVCTTVDSRIEFLTAAINVKYLTAEAKPKKIGKRIRNFNVEIRDDKDTLIASADFVFYNLQN